MLCVVVDNLHTYESEIKNSFVLQSRSTVATLASAATLRALFYKQTQVRVGNVPHLVCNNN